jgi:hypothetical protein
MKMTCDGWDKIKAITQLKKEIKEETGLDVEEIIIVDFEPWMNNYDGKEEKLMNIEFYIPISLVNSTNKKDE